MDYMDLLARLHETIQPAVYLEIGVRLGSSLARSRSRSIAIDPAPQPDPASLEGKPWVKLYQQTSDDFFEKHAADEALEGHPLDFAFIDGLHEFAQVVRDLENVERWGHPQTVVVIHDVIPGNAWTASHAFHEGGWTGDVWRIVPFLREYRPDLYCRLIDAAPTGLLVVSNLDPSRSGMAETAAALDRDAPPDGPEYDALVNDYLATVAPEPPESLRDLPALPRAVPYRVDMPGWIPTLRLDTRQPTPGADVAPPRLVFPDGIEGAYRVRLALTATGMPVLALALRSKQAGGERERRVFLDVERPGALHHELERVALHTTPSAHFFEVDLEGALAPGETLREIMVQPADSEQHSIPVAADMTLDVLSVQATIPPEAALRPANELVRSATYRVASEGWILTSPGQWTTADQSQTASFRIVLDAPINGSHRGRLALTAKNMEVLRLQLHGEHDKGAWDRTVYLDITSPGALHHELGSLWLDAVPGSGKFVLDWEEAIVASGPLSEIRLTPLNYWLQGADPKAGMTIGLDEVDIRETNQVRPGTRFAPERFPNRPHTPKRRHGMRDAVIFAWWIPDNPEAHKVAEYYLGLLQYHHADSKIFVGVNHGSDPAWTQSLVESGLDVEIAEADPAVQVTSDVGGFLAALKTFASCPEAFDLVWFGHTKGASRGHYSDYIIFRHQHDRRLWSRRTAIDRYFENPKIGLYSHRYSLFDPTSRELPDRGTAETDALERIYRDICAPLCLTAWETVFVMRGSVVRTFCDAVGPDFFGTDPADYGGSRWWFEGGFPSIASMQGYEPFIELETDGAGNPREDVILWVDPKQNNRLAMDELRRWRADPVGFQPHGIPRE
jgi:hypothetical protein